MYDILYFFSSFFSFFLFTFVMKYTFWMGNGTVFLFSWYFSLIDHCISFQWDIFHGSLLIISSAQCLYHMCMLLSIVHKFVVFIFSSYIYGIGCKLKKKLNYIDVCWFFFFFCKTFLNNLHHLVQDKTRDSNTQELSPISNMLT